MQQLKIEMWRYYLAELSILLYTVTQGLPKEIFKQTLILAFEAIEEPFVDKFIFSIFGAAQ